MLQFYFVLVWYTHTVYGYTYIEEVDNLALQHLIQVLKAFMWQHMRNC